jgi:hypothetical protein
MEVNSYMGPEDNRGTLLKKGTGESHLKVDWCLHLASNQARLPGFSRWVKDE